MSLQVAALTSGINVPSARFRIRQYIPLLQESGIQVHEFVPNINKYGLVGKGSQGINSWLALPFYLGWQFAKLCARVPGILGSWRFQATWLERELMTGIFSLEGLLKTPIVLDVDDAIWLMFPFSPDLISRIARQATVVVVGNEFLANWFGKYAHEVRIVPTAIDTQRFFPVRKYGQGDRFVVGWSGGSWNLPYLYEIEEPIAKFLTGYPDSCLRVVCDQAPKFTRIPPERVEFIPWSPETEVKALQGIDVGLMPLPDTDWARGKCSFKMLQYMACGVPVIVSPVGMNVSVLQMGEVGLAARTSSEWSSALEALYLDREFSKKCGLNGRRVVEANFSLQAITPQLADIFYSTVDRTGGSS